MEKISEGLWRWWQPQLITLIYITIVLTTISIIVYLKVKKIKVDEVPNGIVFLAEQYVGMFNEQFTDISDGKIDRMSPYIFTLFTFLVVGNTAGLLSLEPVVTSYSVPLTLGLITWLGSYIFGIIYKKLSFFSKYKNPIELVGQFSPLISISFRIFGNVTGGAIITYIVYWFTETMFGYIPVVGEVNLLAMIITPWLHMYFDIFGAIIQAYVFSLLTSIYWSQEVEEGLEYQENRIRKKASKKNKKLLQNA